jgi:hypothetical protein
MQPGQPVISTVIHALVFLTICGAARAQADGAPLFMSQDIMEVRMEVPVYTLIRERPDEEYLDGSFFYTGVDGKEHKLDLKLRTRGRYRRQQKTCRLPPIRLNFRKGQVKDTEFAGQDKLKLVTHCKTSDRYEQLVLREYLAYRILNTLTDESFRARLMRINYIDTDGKETEMSRYGFVIEDKDDIGARIGKKLYSVPSVKYEELQPEATALVGIFEYMIGNTDFSLVAGPANDDCCHNNVLYLGDDGRATPIPYDFDFAGLVSAPYAEPNPQLPIKSVRTRFYRGRCMYNDFASDVFAQMREKEAGIRAEIAALPLSKKSEREVSRYIDDFYKMANDPRAIDKHILKSCS